MVCCDTIIHTHSGFGEINVNACVCPFVMFSKTNHAMLYHLQQRQRCAITTTKTAAAAAATVTPQLYAKNPTRNVELFGNFINIHCLSRLVTVASYVVIFLYYTRAHSFALFSYYSSCISIIQPYRNTVSVYALIAYSDETTTIFSPLKPTTAINKKKKINKISSRFLNCCLEKSITKNRN